MSTVDVEEPDARVKLSHLFYNTVKDVNGNWNTTNGVYYNKWSRYNCYSYATHRADRSHCAGDVSGGNYIVGSATVQEVANLAKNDLLEMGYTDVQIYDYIPQINETQELICVRKTAPGSDSTDFHYMRYDLATDAWYHKLGSSAILKYNGVPQSDVDWQTEVVNSTGMWCYYSTVYSGPIKYIVYSKNMINIGETAIKTINPGNEIICEINIEIAGEYTLRLSSKYFVEYELCNEDLDIVISGTKYSETAGFQASTGTYYLRMNFETYTASEHSVNVSVTNEHTHSYTQFYEWKSDTIHWSYCACGAAPISQAHVVSSSHLTICILCHGMAGGGLLNSVPSDYPHTENGSYILPSGIIVLAPEDEEAYLNGTLEFRTGEIM